MLCYKLGGWYVFLWFEGFSLHLFSVRNGSGWYLFLCDKWSSDGVVGSFTVLCDLASFCVVAGSADSDVLLAVECQEQTPNLHSASVGICQATVHSGVAAVTRSRSLCAGNYEEVHPGWAVAVLPILMSLVCNVALAGLYVAVLPFVLKLLCCLQLLLVVQPV